MNRQGNNQMPWRVQFSYFTVWVKLAAGFKESMPSNTTTEETAKLTGFVSFVAEAATFTVIVIVWAVVGLLPFFRFPPRDAMVQVMLFTGWPFKVAATGAPQATGSVAGALETAVTPVIVS
jgi:hypothetical protein